MYSIRFRFLAQALLLSVASLAGVQALANPIGRVIYSQGEVSAIRSNQLIPLKRRDILEVGDVILTGASGKFSAKLADGSVITLGNNSDLELKHYRYDTDNSVGEAWLETTKGAFRAVTGAIKKMNQSDYKIETPVAFIGIRGTDFWGGFIFGDQLDVTVLSGIGVYVETSKGRVNIDKGQGTTVKRTDLTPTKPKRWPDQKMQKALQSVSLDD